MEKIEILNIHILSIHTRELLENLHEGVLVTPNLDHLVKLQEDRLFYEAYKKADWIICDSQILYFLSNILEHPFHKAIAGSSFFVIFMSFTKMMMIAGSLFLEVGKELPKWQWSISTNA